MPQPQSSPSKVLDLMSVLTEILIAGEFAEAGQKIDRGTRLKEDLGLESIDRLILAFAIEQKPEIGLRKKIPPHDAQAWTTVGTMHDWVEANRS